MPRKTHKQISEASNVMKMMPPSEERLEKIALEMAQEEIDGKPWQTLLAASVWVKEFMEQAPSNGLTMQKGIEVSGEVTLAEYLQKMFGNQLIGGEPISVPNNIRDVTLANLYQVTNKIFDLEKHLDLDKLLDADGNSSKPRRRQKITPLPKELLFKSDNINNGAVSSMSRLEQWEPQEGFAYALEHRFSNLAITYGLPSGENADYLFGLLSKGGPKAPFMVKAHFALWARWYEDKGRPGSYLMVSINQFCSDIGYTKHKGAFKREHKQEAVNLLKAITSIEIKATFVPPNKNKPAARIRGPLWGRGLLAEQDEYGDLFGQAREGKPEDWEPVAFSFSPGPWFNHEEWIRYNDAIGKMSTGLMQLRNDTDQWAILIGGYLATMFRVAQYQPRRLSVSKIFKQTGLAQSSDALRRSSQYQEKFERAMRKLVEVGVLSSWDYTTSAPDDLSEAEQNDPAAISAYYADDAKASEDWRRRVVEITCPMKNDAIRLANAKQKAITVNADPAKRKRGRPRKSEA